MSGSRASRRRDERRLLKKTAKDSIFRLTGKSGEWPWFVQVNARFRIDETQDYPRHPDNPRNKFTVTHFAGPHAVCISDVGDTFVMMPWEFDGPNKRVTVLDYHDLDLLHERAVRFTMQDGPVTLVRGDTLSMKVKVTIG